LKGNQDPIDLSGLITQIIPGKRWKVYYPRRIIWRKWSEIVGDAVAQVSRPLYFKDMDTLVVGVKDSLWMQQLSYERSIILKKINNILPDYSHLKEIYFTIKNIPSSKSYKNKSRKNSKKISLDNSELEALEKISDKELRYSFKQLLINIKKGPAN